MVAVSYRDQPNKSMLTTFDEMMEKLPARNVLRPPAYQNQVGLSEEMNLIFLNAPPKIY